MTSKAFAIQNQIWGKNTESIHKLLVLQKSVSPLLINYCFITNKDRSFTLICKIGIEQFSNDPQSNYMIAAFSDWLKNLATMF